MTAARLRQLFLGLGVLALLTLLFVRTESIDLEKHTQVVDNLRRLKQLEATLNQDILKSRLALLGSYDPLVATLRELKLLSGSLKAGRVAVYGQGQPDLDRRILAYERVLAERESLVERFKSENAVLTNSLRYFPTAVTALAARAGDSSQARSLTAVLHELLRDTLVYNLNRDEALDSKLGALIDRLRAMRSQYPADVATALDNVLSHAQTVLEKTDTVDGLLARLVSLPSTERVDELYQAYNASHEYALHRANVYRVYLYVLSVLLLGYAAYTMLKVGRSNAALARRAAEQQSLVEAGRLLASTLKLPEVLERLAEITRALLRSDVVRIWLRDDASGALLLASQAGVTWSDTPHERRLEPGQGLSGAIMTQARPQAVPDVLAEPRLKNRAWFEAEGLCSLLGVPLLLGEVPVGILACLTRTRREWSPEEVALAQALATPAAVALRNAQLYEEAQTRLAQMRGLTELSQLVTASLDFQKVLDSVVQAALDLIRGDLARLWVVEEETATLRLAAIKARSGDPVPQPIPTRVSYGHGLVGWVIDQKRKRYSPNLLDDPLQFSKDWVHAGGYVSQVATPLLLGERALGALTVATKTPRQFSGEEEGLLELFAAQAATALENARLYEASRRAYEEVARVQNQLTQAQKMDAIGRLAGGIAHDFNNLLTVITGRSEILLRRIGADDGLRRHVLLIQQTARRATTLTQQLLAFGRKQVLAPKVLDLNAVVVGIEKMLRRLIGEDIEVVITPGPDLASVSADPGQLEQVILNLAVNARDAMPRGGKLTIETANVELDAGFVRDHVGMRPGRCVMLAVTDTGVGMDAAVQAHLFEPFFTTKEPGKGTGLGLATVYGIVKQSGGYIAVRSELGRGATFTIYLPRVDAPPDELEPGPAHAGPPRGSETVLLVEDEAAVRDLSREILEAQGYTVLEAPRPGDALLIAARVDRALDLMVTDVVMPEMSGPELAARMARLHPTMRVLYVSGYTDDAMVRHGVLTAGMAFLPKPFTPDGLAHKVREILDAAESHHDRSAPPLP